MLLSVLLLLAGCGDDDEAGGDRADTVDTTSTTAAEKVEEVDAQAALLTLEDLPTGYTTSAEDDDEDPPLESCPLLQALEDDNLDPANKAEVQYEASQTGPIIQHSVAVLKEGEAERIFQDFGEAIDTPECQTLSQQTDEGETATYKLGPLSSPQLGDDTLAFRLTGDEAAFNLTLDFVAERVGNAQSLLAVGSIPVLGGPPPALEPLARKADEKLRAA